MAGGVLTIRMLGELELLENGRAIALPASRKTRALLGYLALTGTPSLRSRLCDLLWDGPDDPRAALRWSLSRLRPLVNRPGRERLVADRERVSFDVAGADLDVLRVRADAGASLADASSDALKRIVESFRGELLEGLELPDCPRYHEWCLAEREQFRTTRAVALATLVERTQNEPAECLRYARLSVAVDPYAEKAHAAVIRLLGSMGRRAEARDQYEHAKRLLERELRARPSRDLDDALRESGAPARAPARIDEAKIAEPVAPVPFVGRVREEEEIGRALAAAAAGVSTRVLLIAGDPGIGKTRLLEELRAKVRAAGGTVLSGRSFEAESVRPYGAWIDALRGAWPEGESPEPGAARRDRGKLYGAVESALGRLLGRGAPAVLILDDVQWMDDASAGLLHYVARNEIAKSILLACAARRGELADNPVALRLVRTLRREQRLRMIELAPLDPSATAALVRAIDPRADAGRVFDESGGNPLFAIEVARAQMRDGSSLSETLQDLIRDRIDRLEEREREILDWAAVLGGHFDAESISRVLGLGPAELVGAFDALERHGLVRPTETERAQYDFAHDLIRRSAYLALSAPRRRMIHLQIARALTAIPDPDGALAAEVARHASLGGDPALAARSSVVAGRRCMRLFARTEAAELAVRGLALCAALPAAERWPLELALLRIRVESGPSPRDVRDIERDLSRFAQSANEAGAVAEAADGLFLLATLRHEEGDFLAAERSVISSARASEAADDAARARSLANAGRCLAAIERDMERAHELLRDAQAAAGRADVEVTEIGWGIGMLRQFDGDHEAATALLGGALASARRDRDHWAVCDCLSRIAMIALETGDFAAALERAGELSSAAAKLGEGSEGPAARALEALARMGRRDPAADALFENAVSALRQIDSKGLLAYSLSFAAELDLDEGRVDRARARAEEALRAAKIVDRRSQMVLAEVLLARLAGRDGDDDRATAHLDAANESLGLGISARARMALARAREAFPR